MSVVKMYHDFRKRFPEATQVADAKHIKAFGSVDDEFAFTWFESLASAINDQMDAPKDVTDLSSIFSFFEKQLQGSDMTVRDCIDVSFVENLFWEVPPNSAANAWDALPNDLRHLYLSCHGRSPTAN